MGGKLQYGPPDFERLQRGPILDENLAQQEPPVVLPPAQTQPETSKEELFNIANQRITDLSKQINPYYERPDFKDVSYSTKEGEKYEDMPFGYVPGLDNDDLYSDTQGFFGSLGTTVLRFPTLVATKLGQNLGFLGGLANPANWGEDIIAKAADNSMSNFFASVEDDVKNSWLRTFNSAEDREKGFFSRMFTDKEFWSEDFVDGAAFMGAAWIPGMTLSKLNVGNRLFGSIGKAFNKNIAAPGPLNNIEAMATGANYFTRAQQGISTLGKFNAIAMATASESLFEANEIKDSIYNSLTKDENGVPRINPQTGQFYTEEEKREIAGKGARNGFLMNAALLGVTNAFELPYVSRLMGFKPSAGLRPLAGGRAIGEELSLAAPKNRWAKFMNSSYGEFAKGMGKGILREGLIEENVQLAIQRLNEELGKNGVVADMLDFGTYAELGKQSFTQAADAMMGQDPVASMNIGLGGLLGGGMTAFGDKAQFKRDLLNTEQAVKLYNTAQENFLKPGNIYKTNLVDVTDADGNITQESKIQFDETGNPIIDDDKLGAVMSNSKAQLTALGISNDVENDSPLLKNISRDLAFADFVGAHIKANNEKGLVQKLDMLKEASQEDLAKLGFYKDENFEGLINRYKALAGSIIKQNKLIESNVRFDQTPADTSRKYMLMDLSSQQSVFRQLFVDEQSYLDELKGEIIDSTNSSLSDGLVDQLNSVRLRIKSQQQIIDALKQQGTKPALLAVYEQGLNDLKSMEANIRRDNETSLAQLKENENGLYSYEKDSRNEESVYNSITQRLKTNGELENHILNLGRQYSIMADSIKGKENYLKLFDETVTQEINKKIEEDNAVVEQNKPATEEDEDLVNNIPLEGLDEVGGAPVQLGRPSLDQYLKETYDNLKQEGKAPDTYDQWANTSAVNFWIKLYNQRFGANEKLVTPKPTTSETLPEGFEEEAEENVPSDLIETEEEDEFTSGEFGTQIKSSVKIGPYIINIGDKINDEEVNLITEKVVRVGDDIMSYDEVLKRIDAFKGRNITRKEGTAGPVTEPPSNNVTNPQDTKQAVVNQKLQDAINKASEGVTFGGSAKVINGGSKVNNQSDFYQISVYQTGNRKINVDRERTVPNPNYPMVMATPAVNIGDNVTLVPNTDLKEFDQADSMNPERITRRRSSEFFTKDGKIKEEAIAEFPIRIETKVGDKTVVLGHVPTLDWLQARWNNDPKEDTMNVVEFLDTPSGRINNLEIQTTKLLDLRREILEGFNKDSKFVLNAVVNAKSDGTLRTDNKMRKLSEALHPATKIGIIKNGSIYVSEDEVLDRSNVIANFKDFTGKEGWPVVLLPTPTGKLLASYVSVPTLAPQHQDFILTAWTAFHNVKAAKDPSTVKDDLTTVKAVYNATGLPFEDNMVPDFNILKNYINDYITFTSGRQYNPLAKEGNSQLNITEKGELTVWAVETRDKSQDVLIAANPRELVKKEEAFRNKVSMLYYNVRTSTDLSNGINSPNEMKFLSSIGGKVRISSSPMTYNEYMMSILETNIEPGRPVDSSKKNSDLVYFANPVLTFAETTASVKEAEEEEDPISKLFGPAPSAFKAKPVPPADIEAKAELRENWIASSESIRKSVTTPGLFEATLFELAEGNFAMPFTVISASTEKELQDKIDQHYRGLLKIEKPTQATPETEEDLLDLDVDFGDTAEDIGSTEPDLKSIKTSLNTLKKTCE